MLSIDYNSYEFFFDLIALSIISLPIFYAMPTPLLRRIVLIMCGLYLLSFIAPRLAIFYVAFWLIVFVMQRGVAYAEKKEWNATLCWISVLITLVPMVLWKCYADSFSIQFNLLSNASLHLLSQRLWEIDLARDIILPLGLSFATFRAIDLLIKTYVGKIQGLHFDRVLFYGFFPPIQMVGPIIEYEEIEHEKKGFLKPLPEDFFEAFLRIASGFIKIFILAALLEKSAIILDIETMQPVWKTWAYLFVYVWFFYFNFSGYSDLAIGISRLYGFKLKENFYYPYFSRNFAEFWSRWHMSLYRFARRNAFIPLGGYRKQTQFVAIAGTMMVISLWHNLTLSMFLFGVYQIIGLIMHRLFNDWLERKDIKIPETFMVKFGFILITHIFMAASFPLIFMAPGDVIPFYLKLLGIGG